MSTVSVGIYLFDHMTMLDAFAPLQFFAFVEGFETFTFAKRNAPVPSDCGAVLTPDYGFEDCPAIDLLVVPGGGNPLPQMRDPAVMDFLRTAGDGARYVTSVCSGALILAEAGLLNGYEAATHWGYRDLLAKYPEVTVVDKRVAVDRTRITGGGVTAGIDFALTVVGEVASPAEAQALQLMFEYRPDPPFPAGGPETAPPEVKDLVGERMRGIVADLAHYVRSRDPGLR